MGDAVKNPIDESQGTPTLHIDSLFCPKQGTKLLNLGSKSTLDVTGRRDIVLRRLGIRGKRMARGGYPLN